MMHTMLRVTNLDKALDFYCNVLDMNLIRRKDYAEGRFTLAFVGYGDEANSTVLELTHNWDTDSYEQGSAYGHIAIGVDDVYATCDRVKAKGGKVIREAGPMKGGRTVIAFLEDPDGYKVELLQDEPNPG
jgi:lactoylglutathione lyase